jgi:hypothetical protein
MKPAAKAAAAVVETRIQMRTTQDMALSCVTAGAAVNAYCYMIIEV